MGRHTIPKPIAGDHCRRRRWRSTRRTPSGPERRWSSTGLLDRNNRSATEHAQGIAYDPEHDEWRVIAARPLSPQASTAAWIGDRMLIWDYELRAGAYDPARDEWTRVPDLPLPFAECGPESALADERLLAWYCGRGAIYDIRSGTWKRLPPPEGEVFGQPVSAGSVILFAGAAHEGHANALWAYKP
jgi:hypothetical protein